MQSAVAVSSGFRASDAARVWLVPLLVGLLVYLLICIIARAALGDGDTLTHIVSGGGFSNMARSRSGTH